MNRARKRGKRKPKGDKESGEDVPFPLSTLMIPMIPAVSFVLRVQVIAKNPARAKRLHGLP